MKNHYILLIGLFIFLVSCGQTKTDQFNTYFRDSTLRIDYFHSGNAIIEEVNIDQVYIYDSWSGSRGSMLDKIDYGTYYHKIYDKKTGKLIYSKGFDSYFKEYQLTTIAIEGAVKEYHESAIIPFPKSNIIFALEKRDKSGVMNEVFRAEIDPTKAETGPILGDVKVYPSLENGDPQVKADVLIVGEGYTKEEEQKFQDDLKRFTETFFRAEPCKSYKDRFNIRGVLRPSEDSGVDEPRAGIDKNTAVNASFNSLGSARYLLTEDNKSLRDIAGHAPYDALYIMVNHSRYGGGGIYNFYCVYTSDNIVSDYLMVHEFGHSFFGLADEYYSSSTAYNDFYPPGYEPNEPNITALKDPDNIKWAHLVSEDISIPTEWNKEEYDSQEQAWQQRRSELNSLIAKLKKEGGSKEEIARAEETYNSESTKRNQEVHAFLELNELSGKVGAFEGAGYASTGMYRPCLNCIMFSRADYFCPVCQDAMIKVIESYSD